MIGDVCVCVRACVCFSLYDTYSLFPSVPMKLRHMLDRCWGTDSSQSKLEKLEEFVKRLVCENHSLGIEQEVFQQVNVPKCD